MNSRCFLFTYFEVFEKSSFVVFFFPKEWGRVKSDNLGRGMY